MLPSHHRIAGTAGLFLGQKCALPAAIVCHGADGTGTGSPQIAIGMCNVVGLGMPVYERVGTASFTVAEPGRRRVTICTVSGAMQSIPLAPPKTAPLVARRMKGVFDDF